MSTDESFETFISGAPNDFFSVKFVGKSKYCLEISQTWERLACSHILFFIFFKRSSSARMKIENAGIYYPQANIGNFSW